MVKRSFNMGLRKVVRRNLWGRKMNTIIFAFKNICKKKKRNNARYTKMVNLMLET